MERVQLIRRRRQVLAAGIPAAVFTACAPATPDDPSSGTRFSSHEAEYVIARTPSSYSAEIAFTYVNLTGVPLYIPGCRGPEPPVLEKHEDGNWTYAFRPVTLDCLSPSLRLDPGAEWTDTLVIWAGTTGSRVYPKFRVKEIPGIYRLMVPRIWDRAEGPFFHGADEDLIPRSYRVSDPFIIREVAKEPDA